MSRIRVLIADDHPVYSSGLRLLLDRQPDFEVVGTSTTGAEALQRAGEGGVDVMLFDLGIAGGGIPVLRALVAHRSVRVIVVSFLDNRAYVETALRIGAAGYFTKRAGADEVFDAIRAVAAGGVVVEAALRYRRPTQSSPPPPDRLEALSPRELQVLGLIGHGHTNREIAERLAVSVKTIEGYRARLLEKLGARTRADLVAYAMLAGLLPMTPTGLDED